MPKTPDVKNNQKIQEMLDFIQGTLGKENGGKLIAIVTDALHQFVEKVADPSIHTITITINDFTLTFDCESDKYVTPHQYDA